MYSSRFSNVATNEGTVDGSSTIVLPRSSGKLILTNDSSIKPLGVQLKPGSDSLTLKPTETLTVRYRTSTIVLTGVSVNYRVWAFS